MGGGPEKEVYFLPISIHFQNVAQVFLLLPIAWGLRTTNSLVLALLSLCLCHHTTYYVADFHNFL